MQFLFNRDCKKKKFPLKLFIYLFIFSKETEKRLLNKREMYYLQIMGENKKR